MNFYKLQVFFNKIIFSYADSWNALNFFKSPWPTLTKAKIMFSSLFSVHHTVFWLVDVWGLGGTDETETFYERSSWQRITNFWWHKLFLRLLSSSSLPLLLASSPASFSSVIRKKSLRARLRTSFLVGEPFRLVNEAISPNIFHQHQMEQSPKCCITNVIAIANVSNLDDLFSFLCENISTKHNTLYIYRSKYAF